MIGHNNYDDVLSFWFHEIEPAKWWLKDIHFDALIKHRFLALHEQAKKCELFEWRDSAKGRLAEIIVLDQFSRNIFRDSPQAFSADPLALALSQEAISLAKHKDLNQIERSFLYMPYMHSESLSIHDIAVELYTDNGIQSNLDFEIQHRDIIEKFGRYPHRNSILNRLSTAEEIVFLKQANSSF
ncbi:DUF924 domain-containing protein [Lentisphaera profundi]|uniref:DUF924 domain-containing protein n=1 Tax=Lentisphaera profundi TaxID=1658616 RepID=A0ABY7VPD2_9BACT|nr:DUF924 family protein [Lentisphaera profundi]WDE95557.1 DUF924 domain-containing protein [Lentisphaera profundi]